MILRRALLVALRWTAYQIGYGLCMGWTEAQGRMRPASLSGLAGRTQ